MTLSWWNNANTQPLLGVFNNVIKQFEAAHPNVTIKNVPMQNEQFKTKVTPALRGNSPPDIYQQWGSGGQATQVQSGKVADISSEVISVDRLARHPGDRVADQREVVRRPLRPARGRLLVPQGPVPAGRDHHARPRPSPSLSPTTPSCGRTASRRSRLGSKDGWPDAFWWEYFAIRECSQSTVTQAMSGVSLSAPCFTKASADLDAFVKTNPFQTGFLATPAQSVPNSSVGLLANGKVAMELQGDWEPAAGAGLTSDKNFTNELGWFPFPAVPGGAGDPKAVLGGGDGYSCTTAAASRPARSSCSS